MPHYDVCGLGNAIVDIFLELDEAEFATLGFERGTMRLVDKESQHALLERFHNGRHDLRLVSGGSVANSIIALSQLGGKAAFIGCVGDDRYGLHYVEEFEQLGIDIGSPILYGETTGTCLAIITPDAERTMRTCLAISSHLSAEHVDVHRISESQWLFIEGYVFANPETGQGAIERAIEIARQQGTKIALTCSDPFIPEVFGEPFAHALRQSDLLFCNGPESMALTGASTPGEAFAKLADMVPNCVVTDGPHGAHVRYDGQTAHVPAVPTDPKDLTGAGDMFAGSFLYGITHGYSPVDATRAANYLSHKVISQIGARMHEDLRELWNEALQ
ncbi:MAG: adenosine kinase [Pirellulaceae bacterium]|nr:MAG: adenosine kinase [Pirellulaceae bacterium]